MSSRAVLVIAAAAALALGTCYLALGGGRYTPPSVADPCERGGLAAPDSGEAVAERLILSALSGAACELGVSRESVALALASRERRESLAEREGIGLPEVESAVRAGIVRAIGDARRDGLIEAVTARVLRGLARALPIDAILDSLSLG